MRGLYSEYPNVIFLSTFLYLIDAHLTEIYKRVSFLSSLLWPVSVNSESLKCNLKKIVNNIHT